MNGYEYQRNRECSCERCARKRIMGGAVLLTLGGLFLLSEFSHIRFHNTWPLLLIVIGVVLVWQHAGSTQGHVPPGALPPQAPPPPPPPPPEAPNPDSSQVPHV